MKEKVLYIIRGLPGTGKSTLAHELTPWVCEADAFFTKLGTGEYKFDPAKLPEAHKYCEDLCRAYMQNPLVTRIAVSNTSSRLWEYEKYIAMAQWNGFRICEITLTGESFGSIHNVPDEAVQRMKDCWEK